MRSPIPDRIGRSATAATAQVKGIVGDRGAGSGGQPNGRTAPHRVRDPLRELLVLSAAHSYNLANKVPVIDSSPGKILGAADRRQRAQHSA